MGEYVKNKISYMANSATKTEKILIEKLDKINQSDLIYMSISELAEKLNVAEATILRFCRKLGFKGYQEFKLVLAQDIKSEAPKNNGYLDKIANNVINSVMTTKDMIEMNDVRRAAQMIIDAKHIHFFGVGNSGTAALEVRNKLARSGVVVNACTDPHFQSVFAATMKSEDVLVLISVSGSTVDIIDCAKLATENNVKIIVVTNHFKSPLSKYGDIKLFSLHKEAPLEGGSLSTKISQLLILDVLCHTVTELLGDNVNNNLEKSAASLLTKLV